MSSRLRGSEASVPWHISRFSCSQQQNALGYNLSMRGIGTVAIDGPRFEEFLRSRKGGLARGSHKDFVVGLHSWANLFLFVPHLTP